MPQIDKISFFPQIFWLLLFFFILYFIVENNLLLSITQAHKLRRKKIIFSSTTFQNNIKEKEFAANQYEKIFTNAFLEITKTIQKKFQKTKDFSIKANVSFKELVKSSKLLNHIVFQIKTKNLLK